MEAASWVPGICTVRLPVRQRESAGFCGRILSFFYPGSNAVLCFLFGGFTDL